jgi:hypothetical protein
LAERDFAEAHRNYDAHLLLPVQVARKAVGEVRPSGTLLVLSRIGGRHAASEELADPAGRGA